MDILSKGDMQYAHPAFARNVCFQYTTCDTNASIIEAPCAQARAPMATGCEVDQVFEPDSFFNKLLLILIIYLLLVNN